MSNQRRQAVPDQPDRGFESGDQQPHRVRDQLDGVELVALFLRCDQYA